MTEIRRLGPVAPIAPGRYAENDATLNGVKIPGGSKIFAFLYPMTVDPKKWLDPYKFDPERHLVEHDKRETLLTFGTGTVILSFLLFFTAFHN